LKFDGVIFLVQGDEVKQAEAFSGTQAEARTLAAERLRTSGADRAEVWSGPVPVVKIRASEAAGE
jgi:hypothetical protein